MLALSRRINESLVLLTSDGKEVIATINIANLGPATVRLAITAPNVKIMRYEIMEEYRKILADALEMQLPPAPAEFLSIFDAAGSPMSLADTRRLLIPTKVAVGNTVVAPMPQTSDATRYCGLHGTVTGHSGRGVHVLNRRMGYDRWVDIGYLRVWPGGSPPVPQ